MFVPVSKYLVVGLTAVTSPEDAPTAAPGDADRLTAEGESLDTAGGLLLLLQTVALSSTAVW